MKNFILKTIGMVGVSLVFKETYIDSYLSYMRIDFVDKYGKFCIFDVFYNDTQFFTEDLLLLGTGKEKSLSDLLRSRIKVIGSLEDYKVFYKKIPSKEDLDKLFCTSMETLVSEIMSINIKWFSLRKVDFYSDPALMLFIHFNYKGKRQKPIKIFIGEKISYSSDLDVSLLIEKIEEVLYVR